MGERGEDSMRKDGDVATVVLGRLWGGFRVMSDRGWDGTRNMSI